MAKVEVMVDLPSVEFQVFASSLGKKYTWTLPILLASLLSGCRTWFGSSLSCLLRRCDHADVYVWLSIVK